MSQKEKEEGKLSEFVEKYLYLVRPCDEYNLELQECKAIRGRFHQYFTEGAVRDCTSWVTDNLLCAKCIEQQDNAACTKIIVHEIERKKERLRNHLKNDVWEKRTQPPDNWNMQLPDSWVEQNKNSLLIEKAEEYEKYVATTKPTVSSFCVIL